jgi:hypothetical protein
MSTMEKWGERGREEHNCERVLRFFFIDDDDATAFQRPSLNADRKTSRQKCAVLEGVEAFSPYPLPLTGTQKSFCCQIAKKKLRKATLTKSTEWLGALVGGAAIAARDDDERRAAAARMGSAWPKPWICAQAEARREAVAGRAPIADEARRAKAMALRAAAGRDGKGREKEEEEGFFL